MRRGAPDFVGPMNSTMLPSGSLTKTWRRPVGPETTSRQGNPKSEISRAVLSASSVQRAKCAYRARIFSRSIAGRTSWSFKMMCSERPLPRLYQMPGKSKAGRGIYSSPSSPV